MKRALIVAVAILCLEPGVRAQFDELNLSTDLVRLGIASHDMVPDRRELDSRPLFNAALEYVKSHGVGRVTLDSGAYYFLSPRPDNGAYAFADGLEDVTFDFNQAHFYLHDPYRFGFFFLNATRTSFERFTIDYLDLPFTQVQVTAVQARDRVLGYQVLPGFRDPTDFNVVREFPSGTAPRMFVLVFRDGRLLAGTGRTSIATPLEPGVVRIDDESGHAASEVIRTVRAGDTLVILGQGNGMPWTCHACTETTVRNVDVYAGPMFGLTFEDPTASVVEHVRVIPRPGTDRLISTNADGIHLSNARGQNVVRRSEVRGSGDDGIAVNSGYMAYIDHADSTSVVAQASWKAQALRTGTNLSFVSAATGAIVGTARLLAQDPPNPGSWYGGAVRLFFDRPIPALLPDSGVVLADAADRGEGTVVEDNLVADNFLSRGIYVAGSVGVTVRNNTVLRTAGAGILIEGTYAGPRRWGMAPVERIDVLSNRVEDAIRPGRDGHSGSAAALGALQVVNLIAGVQTTRAHKHVRFIGNIVTGSGRSGIWAGNVGGLTIENNTVDRSGLFASAPIYGWPATDLARLRQEIAQDIAIRSSDER
jgi:parallel beta-helix repeat protein